VFYFFKKGTDTITCEVRTSAAGPGYDIIIIEPGAPFALRLTPRLKPSTSAGWSSSSGFSATGGGGRTFRMDGRKLPALAMRAE
jgi:hypothetical protein